LTISGGHKHISVIEELGQGIFGAADSRRCLREVLGLKLEGKVCAEEEMQSLPSFVRCGQMGNSFYKQAASN